MTIEYIVSHQRFDEDRRDDHGWRYYPVKRKLSSIEEVVSYIKTLTPADLNFSVKVSKFKRKQLTLSKKEEETLGQLRIIELESPG